MTSRGPFRPKTFYDSMKKKLPALTTGRQLEEEKRQKSRSPPNHVRTLPNLPSPGKQTEFQHSATALSLTALQSQGPGKGTYSPWPSRHTADWIRVALRNYPQMR